ncbi:MAG: ATP-binding protein [Kangiellaceae bacterium]|nr:ATP-binding protein [Kangiellaceae bacterium]
MNRSPKSYFPWPTMLLAMVVVYLFASHSLHALPFSHLIKEFISHPTHLTGLIIALLLAFVFDLLVFTRRQKHIREHIEGLNLQINLTREQRKKQQLRANEVSDHSDKLKSFISDKLIEYMDFDEKFIHFKGIASEVRHNGVISYDKINSALNKAIEQQNYLAIYEQNNDSENSASNGFDDDLDLGTETSATNQALYDYQTAKDAIAYLWDLLDLSTAENMSLYIGKKLIDYEEMYYQTQLNPTQHDDLTESLGISPTFYPLRFVLMTMRLFSDDDKFVHLLANAKINESLLTAPFRFEDDQFVISLEPTKRILGNPNHLVLLLENLIRNAQFFSCKARYKQKSDRIIISLDSRDKDADKPEHEDDSMACISVYNRGRHIEIEDLDSIFKLGYTTRRKSDANGRGLGLYFVNEIIKGYQGSIKAFNVENESFEYKLILTLVNKEQIEFDIQSKEVEGKIQVATNDDTYTKDLRIEKDIPIESIQLMINDTEVFSANDIEQDRNYSWRGGPFENTETSAPTWTISLSSFKKKQHLIFQGLDRTGVQFDILLPLVSD